MDRDLGDFLEEYLGGILEFNAGTSGLEEIPKDRMRQLKARYETRFQLENLIDGLHEEGIDLMAVNLDRKYEYLELMTNIFLCLAEGYGLRNQFDYQVQEGEKDGKYLTSLIFEKRHIPEIRGLFDFYATFLRQPNLFPEFAGPLLREYFDSYLLLEKDAFGIVELEEEERKKLTDIVNEKDLRVNGIIEKQGVVIHGYYRLDSDEDRYSTEGYLLDRGEDEEICLETDILQEDAETIIRDLKLNVRTESHSQEDFYITKLISKISHADQLVTVVDSYVNYINCPQQPSQQK